MDDLFQLLKRVGDSITSTQANYQIWFTLRGKGKALPDYYDDMNDHTYVDFFHVINAGTYKLMYIELGCLFDPDSRTSSMRMLKSLLRKTGRPDLDKLISKELKEYEQLVSNILTIRSTLMAHKELNADSMVIHAQNEIIPDEIGRLIAKCASLVKIVHQELYGSNALYCSETTTRFENATFGLLNTLQKGRS